MAGKLKSVFKIVQLRLILNGLIFAGLLFWARASDFRAWPVLLFVLISFVLYFRNQGQNNSENIYSFFILLLVAILGAGLLNHLQFLLPAIIFFAILFYLILGIKELAFTRRYEWNFIKTLFLIYSTFLVYFLSDPHFIGGLGEAGKYVLFYVKYLTIFLIIFLLAREWFFWLDPSFPKRYNFTALILSFIALQLLWAVSILPLGFLNSATLMTVFIYLMFDSCADHFKGLLTKKRILKNIIILAASILIIFALTRFSV